jgi:nucleotide-binding universal stress UspA family protein
MLPVEKILCPVDFSGPSSEALSAAKELAQHFSAELTLFHAVEITPVLPPPQVGSATATIDYPAYQKAVTGNAERLLTRLREEHPVSNVMVRQQIVQGRPADEIIKYADQEAIDLIVMATHGQSGWRRLLFGSVAEKVLRMSRCPVLVISEKS